jgi:hypothetical protein
MSSPEAVPADWQRFLAQAVAIVRIAATAVRGAIDGYDRVLLRDAGELAGRGYVPAPAVPAAYEGATGALALPGAVPPPPGTDPHRV